MEFDNSIPIYLQLASEWRRMIVSRKWPSGEKIESVRDLGVRYSVNPNTVQRALGELEREGLAISKRTAGRYITEDLALITKIKQTMTIELIERFVQEVHDLDLDNDFLMERLEQAIRASDQDIIREPQYSEKEDTND